MISEYQCEKERMEEMKEKKLTEASEEELVFFSERLGKALIKQYVDQFGLESYKIVLQMKKGENEG